MRLVDGCLVTVLALCSVAAPPQEAADGWQRVVGRQELSWPRDHGAHPGHRIEWWYVTGTVADESGSDYGFQFTVFRSGLDPSAPKEGESPLRARQVLAAHLVVTDIAADRTVFAERLRRTGTPLATYSTSDLALELDGWRMAGLEGDGIFIEASDAGKRIGLSMLLEPKKPLVLHGDHGVSSKGPEPGNASVYASWTRLAVEGTLTIEGREALVRGGAWFDHEWGSSVLGEGILGWDWFGLRLDDGRDLMLFTLRRADGSIAEASTATLVERDGSTRTFGKEALTLRPLGTWKSPRSGAVYPSGWRLAIAGTDLDLELQPRVRDCELSSTGSTGVAYWEGPVSVSGRSEANTSIRGEGYAELTGYAGTMAGRF